MKPITNGRELAQLLKRVLPLTGAQGVECAHNGTPHMHTFTLYSDARAFVVKQRTIVPN